MEFTDEEFSASQRSYPLVGLLIGILLGILASVLNNILKFPIFTTAIFVLAFEIYLSGGLHLDGLIDSADGFLNNFYKDKEQILKIMKDSRIGANGASALFGMLLLKLGLLIIILPDHWEVLILMPLISRWILLYLSATYPYGGTGSLGSMVIGKRRSKELKTGTVLALISSLGLLFVTQRINTYPLVKLTLIFFSLGLSSLVSARFLAYKVCLKLGGITGDILGAILELVEVLILFIAAALLGLMG